MTNVIPRPSLRAGFQVQPSALSLATWHLHHGRTEQDLDRSLSAARHLQQVSAESPGMEGLRHD